jgi:hypothetical protein
MEGMCEEPFWISGLTVSALLDHLKLHGLECEGSRPRGETMSQWECKWVRSQEIRISPAHEACTLPNSRYCWRNLRDGRILSSTLENLLLLVALRLTKKSPTC